MNRDSSTFERRPWGSFEILGRGEGYQVKRLVVAPGRRLSLQSHRHRSEHWVVVQGVAEVTVGERQRSAATGEHVFIPLGARHRLGNRGTVEAVLIEVQLGDRLEESDIVRYEDDYDRA